MRKPLYFHKLFTPVSRDVIFAHFSDPESAREIDLKISSENFSNPNPQFTWCSTNFFLTPLKTPAHLKINLFFRRPLNDFDKFICALSLSKGSFLSVNAWINEKCYKLCRNIPGEGKRIEINHDIDEALSKTDVVDTIEFVFSTKQPDPLILQLFWAGFGSREPLPESGLLSSSDHEYFFKNSVNLSKPKFATGLLFDESTLDDVRGRLNDPVWARHFSHMEKFAHGCLQRDPFADVQAFNPGYDDRFVRESERGRAPFYWEALTVAFVGLVKQDPILVKHAQRYMLSMTNAPFWFSSSEEVIPSSSWDARSFVAEMTATSLSILWDWLDFTLEPRYRNVLAKALWRRGMAPVQGDLMKFPYMHQMNQGPVFCRSLVLGGLMLEKHWQMGQFVDQYYKLMINILKRIDLTQEGPVYACQLAHAVSFPIIAWSRKRNKKWQKTLNQLFKPILPYLQTLSQRRTGTCTPIGDSRIEGIGGDLIPLLAAINGSNTFCKAVSKANLENGSVFRASGTLTNSGGILALVHGPNFFEQNLVYKRSELCLSKTSGKARSTRVLKGHEISLLFNGTRSNAGHAHNDAGSFVLEIGDDIVFSDPGMITYGQIATAELKEAGFHNVLIPLEDDDQPPSTQNATKKSVAKSFKAKGSESTFDFFANLDGVWSNLLEYSRRTFSKNSNEIEIIDRGASANPRRYLFRLVTSLPVELFENKFRIFLSSGELTVSANWSNEAMLTTRHTDLSNQPLSLLSFTSQEMTNFEFNTLISIRLN